jgi:small-conductance mechanosensitive channel
VNVDNNPFEAIRKQQEQIRRLMESPALDALRKQQEQIQKLVSEAPVLEALRRQEEQIRQITTEPPALEAIRKHQEQIQELNESPFLDAMRKQQEQIQKLTQSPQFVQLAQQQQEMAKFWANEPLEPFGRFREEVAVDALRYAEDEAKEETLPGASEASHARDPLFTFKASQYLLWQLQGLIKVLEILSATGGVANEFAEDPLVSGKLLAVMLMVALIGELMVWIAHRPPEAD